MKRTLTGRRTRLVAGLSVAILLGAAGGVLASDAFDDVGDSHPFHDEIGWMADQGISTGYPNGTYRPNEDVTRQAMSAFMQRLAPQVEIVDNVASYRSFTSSSEDVDKVISIDKRSAGSLVKVTWTTHMRISGPSNAVCQAQIGANDATPDEGTGAVLHQDSSGDNTAPVTVVEYFEGLPAGTNTFDTYVRVVNSATCELDVGNFTDNGIVVEEIPYLPAP